MAARLATAGLLAVYSSDLSRARETGLAVAQAAGVPLHLEPRLREVAGGTWTGLSLGEVQAKDAAFFAHWMKDPMGIPLAGGESYRQVMERAWAAFDEIVARHRGGKVALIGHGGSLRTILLKVLGLDHFPSGYFELSNAGVSLVEVRETGPVLVYMNSTCHLELA